MFTYPPKTGADMIRKNIEAQLSLLTSLSGKFFNATLQLSELNRQASNRLLEESAAEMQKALQIHTLADAQSFIGEQSKSSVYKLNGYWQNVQKIASDNWMETAKIVAPFAEGRASQAEPPIENQQMEKSSEQRAQNEEHVAPSPLVKNLVAKAGVGVGKAGA